MPTTPPPTLRVAECGSCGQLFAVTATDGQIACPACEAKLPVAALQLVELNVAAPVEVKIEAPELAAPEPLAPEPTTAEPTGHEPTGHEPTPFEPAPELKAPELSPLEAQLTGSWAGAEQPEELTAEEPAPEADSPEPEAAAQPEALEEVAETPAETPLPAPAEAPRAPTVAEWLMREGSPSQPTVRSQPNEAPPHETASLTPAPAETPPYETTPQVDPPRAEAAADSADDTTPAPKRSLAQSLGWRTADSEASLAPPAEELHPEPTADNANSAGDFRFDYDSTPLATPSEPSPGEDDVTLDLSGVLNQHEADESQAEPFRLDDLANSQPRRRRWLAPLSSVAGLLLVAAPAAYMVWTWPQEGEVAANAGRERRLAVETAEAEPTEPAPAIEDRPFAEESATEASAFAQDEPFVDPATRPASFDRPETPPQTTVEEATSLTQNADDTPDGSLSTDPAEDPFMAPMPPPAAAEATASASDRYASIQPPAEPEEFSLPEDTPSQLDAPPAEPAVPRAAPTGEVGLVNAPRYGVADLSAALTAAEPAGKGFASGTLSDPEQVTAMGQHYARLCYLAQVVTMLDPAANDPSLMTTELQSVDVFKRVFRGEQPRVESRQIAGPWIAWSGRPHGGVFFAGVPTQLAAAGELVQYNFRVGEQEVPVVMQEPLSRSRFINSYAKEVGVIGVVVENPREWLAGYEGDDERVVWVRKTIALPRPTEL